MPEESNVYNLFGEVVVEDDIEEYVPSAEPPELFDYLSALCEKKVDLRKQSIVTYHGKGDKRRKVNTELDPRLKYFDSYMICQFLSASDTTRVFAEYINGRKGWSKEQQYMWLLYAIPQHRPDYKWIKPKYSKADLLFIMEFCNCSKNKAIEYLTLYTIAELKREFKQIKNEVKTNAKLI